MARYYIYSDESRRKGKRFGNFFGGVLVGHRHRQRAAERLQRIKDEEKIFTSEMKWTKITTHYEQKYIRFMREYFTLIREGLLRTRIMFTDTGQPHSGNETKAEEYFKLYYQFLKNAFGLSQCNPGDKIELSIFLDRVPQSKTEFQEFVSHVSHFPTMPEFETIDLNIPKNQVVNVDSKKHVIMQALDVNLGAMASQLNHDNPEQTKRGIAKNSVCDVILEEIRKDNPDFEIHKSTGNPNTVWVDPYRHWCFTPKNTMAR